jgi:DNA-binding transcriptional MerR regulator
MHDISTRALVVALKSPSGGKTTGQVAALTGLSPRTIDSIYARAIQRGFDPNALPIVIKDEHLKDAPRSGRPLKQTEPTKDTLTHKVSRDRYGRERTCADLAGELSHELNTDISATTVFRCLKSLGYRKTKPTRKPGLTKKMKEERLKWCLDHQDWTLDDWKNVIWSDETSVVLGHRRGGYRVWRTSNEAFQRSCIRERWKGFSEFMFWGCFTYDRKGPCHIWTPETAQEKKESERILEQLNQSLEAEARVRWELESGVRRLGLRNMPGRKPKFRWCEETGKLVRSKGNGVDWYRYQTKILIPKLFPFAKECLKDRPNTIIQEDKAPPHIHHDQHRVYNLHKIQQLLWCSNSPDLNAIKPCWFWMKRHTTKKGAPESRAQATKVWEACWRNDLQQEQIQAWIERIPRHIEEIIRLEGGNEYKEGRNHLTRSHS